MVTRYLVHEEEDSNYYHDEFENHNEDDFIIFEEDIQDYIDHLIECGYKKIGKHCMAFEKYEDDGDCEFEGFVEIKKQRVFERSNTIEP